MHCEYSYVYVNDLKENSEHGGKKQLNCNLSKLLSQKEYKNCTPIDLQLIDYINPYYGVVLRKGESND